MAKPSFVVKIADLERGPKTVTWPIPPAWLASVFEGIDAVPRGDDGVLEVELSKSGNDVLVRGYAAVNVLVPCVVTLELLPFELRPEIVLMLGKAPSAPGTPGERPNRARKNKSAPAGRGSTAAAPTPAKAAPAKAGASGRGRPRGGGAQESWQEDQELSSGEAARDVYEGDQIVLDEFLREFILLELPLYPRRSDLPPSESPARDSPPAPGPSARLTVDPRLMPLAELRDRLQKPEKDQKE